MGGALRCAVSMAHTEHADTPTFRGVWTGASPASSGRRVSSLAVRAPAAEQLDLRRSWSTKWLRSERKCPCCRTSKPSPACTAGRFYATASTKARSRCGADRRPAQAISRHAAAVAPLDALSSRSFHRCSLSSASTTRSRTLSTGVHAAILQRPYMLVQAVAVLKSIQAAPP